MKFSQIKFVQSIHLHGTQLTFIESDRHKCNMEMDDKGFIVLTTDKDTIIVTIKEIVT